LKSLIVLALMGLSISSMASVPLSIETASDQNINLETQVIFPVTIVSDGTISGEVKLSLDTKELFEKFDKNHEVSAEFEPATITLSQRMTRVQVGLKIKTLSSAPSFSKAKIILNADSGVTHADSNINLTVNPVYIVDVINGTGKDQFAFNSPEEVLRFSPHLEGLVIKFRNLSDSEFVIHGTGAIPHGSLSSPIKPKVGVYEVPPILPRDGDNLPGYYTIHNVYHPERNIVVNAVDGN
jgi:hypothetical protein